LYLVTWSIAFSVILFIVHHETEDKMKLHYQI